MHQSALLITLATVALGASARFTADINTHSNKNDATIATVNILNPGTIAARDIVKINIEANPNANVKSESSTVRHPMTVELGKNILSQEKPLKVNVVKRLDQNLDNILQKETTIKLINVDLTRRLDVDTNVLDKESKVVDAHIAKRLDLNIGANTQESQKLVDINTQDGHKLINVDLTRRLDINTNVLNQENKVADARIAKRLDLNLGANTQEGHKLVDVNTQDGHKLINVDLARRLDINTNVLNQENKLADAHVAKRLDLNIDPNTQEGQKL
ncbi:hypothetical protein BGZ95_009438, partial [Linnemannia exigua]